MDFPRLTADIAGTGGRVRERLDDFVVEEIPAYYTLGLGDHTYLRVEKRGITTFEAARRVAHALGVRPRDVGYAGLKDARSIAIQTFSVEHVPPARAGEALAGVEGVRLLDVRLHRNKLRRGHLRGNRFTIVVRGAEPGAAERALAILTVLAQRGCPNWFGEQRFGTEGTNAAAGRLLLAGDFDGASKVAGRDLRAAPRPLVRLLVSAYQSDLFNRVLLARMPDLGRLVAGDLACFHDRGAVFRVEDPAREQPRADRFEVSPSGPLFGAKMIEPTGAPGEFERALLAAEGLTPASFHVPRVGTFPGERRALRVPVTDPEVRPVADDATAVELRFALPRGSYATAVLHEVVKA